MKLPSKILWSWSELFFFLISTESKTNLKNNIQPELPVKSTLTKKIIKMTFLCNFRLNLHISRCKDQAIWQLLSTVYPILAKKSRQKNSWNQINNFFSWNCIFGYLKLFPSSKIHIWPFLKLQKMEFGLNKFSWNRFIWFHEFF